MKHVRTVPSVICLWILAIAATGLPADAALYVVSGRAWGVHEAEGAVGASVTSAIPGVTADEPDPLDPTPAGALRHDSRAFLPGVTIEAYQVPSGLLLDSTQASRQGFFRLEYSRATVANHEIEFRVFHDFSGGGREFLGESEPVLIDRQTFTFNLEIPIDASLRPGTASFSAVGQFAFVEVGDVDIDNIWDPEANSADAGFSSDLVGFTRDTAVGGFDSPFNGHRLGPDLAFGGALELYGLFESTAAARYYRLNWSGPGASTGVITNPLFKKNYILTSTGVEVLRVRLGPQTVGAESNLYRLDEFMEGQVDADTGLTYSGFWTELGMRARWSTGPLTPGKYTVTVQAFDALGNEILPAPSHPYSSLSLHIDNRAPTAKIVSIHYVGPRPLPPPPPEPPLVLGDSAPCQTVFLNTATPTPEDDSLSFKVIARHPGGLLRQWVLDAYHGHNTYDGVIASDTPTLSFPLVPIGPNGDFFQTPVALAYQTCAYRFRLHVWPRITNGYHLIHSRQDNWYASIQVIP